MTEAQYKYQIQELELKLKNLQQKVKDVFIAGESWNKDKDNAGKRAAYFAKREELKKLVNPEQKPKQSQQAQFNWLAQ